MAAAEGLGNAAANLQSAVITGAGHWVAEQAPDQMVAVVTNFLEPYRVG